MDRRDHKGVIVEKFLKSRYRIGEKIGENPFSFTYKGYLMGTEVPVVVKIYKRSALNSPLINKLRPKVTKIISLDHPNIARVIDGDYGWQGFYFIREFVDGENLEDFLSRGVPELPFTINVIKQVLSSISLAHKENLIHGAINSRNVFLSGTGEVKVADFTLEPGVRKNPNLLAAAASTYSYFMSPEQLRGEDITPTSDIYSIGVLFYYLLTGGLPFNGSGGLDTALGHMLRSPELPSHLNSSIPSYLDELVLKMLEKDPLQRINRADDVLESLNKQRLIYNMPEKEFVNLIYEEDVEPIIYEEDVRPKKKKIVVAGKKIGRPKLFILLVLTSIAFGLWLAFVINLVNAR